MTVHKRYVLNGAAKLTWVVAPVGTSKSKNVRSNFFNTCHKILLYSLRNDHKESLEVFSVVNSDIPHKLLCRNIFEVGDHEIAGFITFDVDECGRFIREGRC